tara:strand:+ start:378 stop:1133 length:756 start_codon:yes stop_codon:yes gene_type:complete
MKLVEKDYFYDAIKNLHKSIKLNDLIISENIVIIKSYLCQRKVNEIIDYLNKLIINNTPAYEEISHKSTNFYRTNFQDHRSFVKGHFHQVNFFPWNKDDFSFYSLFGDVFNLKNILNGLKEDEFLDGNNPDFVPKISFQFYDSGAGFLERHTDPVGSHQSVVPILSMSSKGEDFISGGLEVEIDGKWHIVDDYVESGDLILMNGDLPHGVQKIDPEKDFNLYGSGRWMGLFAINKVAGSEKAPNSTPLNAE